MLVYRALALFSFIWGHVVADTALQLRNKVLDSSNFIIDVANADLSDFSGPRSYYTLAILTSTDDRHDCEACHVLERIVAKVARSYYRDHILSDLLFFANIDIIDRTNVPVFDTFQLTEIPHIWLIPPSHRIGNPGTDGDSWDDKLYVLKQPHLNFKLPVAQENAQVMALAQWIAQTILKPIHVEAADEGAYYFVRNFIVTLTLILIVKKRGPRAFSNAGKKPVYTILVIAAILLFTCGYHFTTLERVPFVAQDDNHHFVYISGGTHFQFGIETVLVAANYLLLAAATISLIYLSRYRVHDDTFITSDSTKTGLIFVSAITVYLLYSCLTSIVLRKDHEYPYALAKLF